MVNENLSQATSKRLGHHAESFTLKVCKHRMPGKGKSEVDSLDDPDFFVRPDAPCHH